ncbi:NAD(P)-dependent dehydrogenase, short-chain alcohol dehydrogenase family [Dyadobacter soli]|uniref:NAD(P)-dependent dehydrogenase, short-chain alcohol dehydrogenase family n=1 Tax=Dyadobacter soli TaxID=659014 RepID=A0A1G7VWH9_9BACT|nr:oxidoreductase [Dyadobacter soli]SDG63789.1 NAD(P)-dependent dehydrogenase, short-chain alcohol dehydrogenase family [Dyadobacter soli]
MWTKKNIGDQTGKTVIVTGANTGIGYETALALFEAGAHVVLACRSERNAQDAEARLLAQGGKGSLEIAILNLANLNAIGEFARAFIQKHKKLDILINNAGVMTPPASKTDDGFELQFGVNFLGHYALTGHLYPLLNATPGVDTPGSRVVTVSSMAYLRGVIDFDNLHSEHSYDAFREYAQSKLANVLFSVELQRRIEAAGDQVISVAAQPGANKTDLSRFMTEAEYNAAVDRIGALMEPWQGALPSLYAAVADDVQGGNFYSPDEPGGYRGYPAKLAIEPHGLDETVAKRLWDWAETESGIRYAG